MKRPAAAALALLAAAVTAGCDRSTSDGAARVRPTATTSTVAPECAGRPKAVTGGTSGTLEFGGVDRTYLVHVPASYDGAAPVPVVFNFHGFGSSAAEQIAYGDFRPLAEREGFVVVAPDGQGRPRHFTLLGATATEADDVDFTTALLDHLSTQLCLDERRVYATGMSNGGALSAILACRAGDRFAAVGAVAAVVYLPTCASATPIVAMMGTADAVVPYAGGRVSCCGNPTIRATEATMADFAARAGCEVTPTEDRPWSDVVHRSWPACASGGAVELYTIEGGAHAWPRSFPAVETLWSFFAAHPRPPT